MKKLMTVFISFSITTTSLIAWEYYGPSNYGGYYSNNPYSYNNGQYPYSYPNNEQYPYSYSENGQYSYNDNRQYPYSEQNTAQTNSSQTNANRPSQDQDRSPKTAKSLEQQHTNLIVMFTKDKCPYCDYMKPIMKKVEDKFGKDIDFLFVDIAQNPQYATQYGFSTVPHIVYFKDGKELDAHGSGNKTMTVTQVEEKIKTYFGDDLAKN